MCLLKPISFTCTSRRTVVSDWHNWTRQNDRTRLIFFLSAILLFTFILLFLLSFSVSSSYFNLAVPMRKCLGKHSCMSSPFSIVILNGTCYLRAPILLYGDVPAIQQLNYKLQTKFKITVRRITTNFTKTHFRMTLGERVLNIENVLKAQ